MKYNAWTLTLAATGMVSLASVAYAEEQVMSQVLTAVSSTTLSGYVDTSVIWKPGTGNTMVGRAFDGTSKMDGFNLNVVGLTLERPLGEDTWAAGYRADLLFGPDAVNYNPSYALNTQVGGGDVGIKQAYVALRAPIGNGLDFKLGVFNTPLGYESFESYLNPNYSRSYGWQLEPTQHTGLLVGYQLTEAVNFQAGIANTWAAGVNQRSPRAESQKAYMAALSITAPDSWGFLSGSSFYVGVVEGFAGVDGTGNSDWKDTCNVYTGFNLQTGVEGLSVGAAFDYRFNGFNTVTPNSNWAYALAGYVSFQATEKWRLSGRLDYSTGSDGTYYNGGADFGSPTAAVSDEQNELFSATLTADYALWANVITRAELKWDSSLADDKPFGRNDENAVTLAANVIYKF